jgi:hypothetical protein
MLLDHIQRVGVYRQCQEGKGIDPDLVDNPAAGGAGVSRAHLLGGAGWHCSAAE